jgi:protoporphyrinogen/coproporphyrinogen III oxidase
MSASSSNRCHGKRIAIIGGGITGLSAAWHALEKGFEVELFESQDKLGGILGTIYWNGRLIEGAADNFATLDDEALQWCRKLGLEDEFISPSADHRFAMVLHHGHPKPIPAGFSLVQPTRIWPIVTTPVLSLMGKMRLVWEYFVPARRTEDDESLYDFACRRLGKETFERLVEPIVGGIFTADPKRLSMQATLPQFVKMEKEHGGLIRGFWAQRRKRNAKSSEPASGGESASRRTAIDQQASGARYAQFMAPKKGMSWWITAIEERLSQAKVHLNTQVVSVQRNESFRRVEGTGIAAETFASTREWELTFGAGEKKEFDAVVVATPSAIAARLLSEVNAKVGEHLKQLRAASSAVVAMVIARKDVAKMAWCFGIVIPQVENRPVLAVSFTGLKYPGRVQDDELLVRVFMGGSTHPEMMHWSDERLMATASQELGMLIGWQGEPRWSKVIRWVDAMPQYDVGHVQRVAALETDLRGTSATIRLAGASYTGVGVPQCVRSGRRAVEGLSEAILPK